LKQADALWGKVNIEGAHVKNDWVKGPIAQSVGAHSKTLHELGAAATQFRDSYRNVREKWSYYPEQTSYVFGNNENEGPNTLINAVEGYAGSLDRWAKIDNKADKDVQLLLGEPQDSFDRYSVAFFHWVRASSQRLMEMKKSIQ
jgi:hypothetical protein